MCLFMRENVCQSWKQTIKTISFYNIKWNPSMRQIFPFLPSAFMQVFFLQFSLKYCDVFVLFYLVNIKILRLGLCTFVLFCNIVVLNTLPMYWCNKWQSITLLKKWLEKSRTISIEIWIRTSCTLQWNIRHFTDPPESKLCLVVLDDKLICFLHFSSFCSFFIWWSLIVLQINKSIVGRATIVRVVTCFNWHINENSSSAWFTTWFHFGSIELDPFDK